ncbi:MAG: hypothetical protein IOC92_05500 [Rhodobacter sp.]|jgi:hypothetical protein|nr:hypothetical protein [Rhodobacter sp.]MCA3456104.1 hypothetical protein [Rhodobacter sp.]MCA3461220.1 hypothetical protein [Rhodobacter sp.]MCA3464957.1 hypothetical protein [Rhodobacter sp.]MCA3469029.1 hypothetical protein [Rhodobacter sp.]
MSKIGYAQRIKSRTAELEALIASASKELDELRVAERVLARLGGLSDEKGPEDGYDRTSTTKDMTVADAAVDLLGRIGPMDTITLLSTMQREWRPDLQQTTLSSTLSRTKAQGRVVQIDGKWQAALQSRIGSPEGDPTNTAPEVGASGGGEDLSVFD